MFYTLVCARVRTIPIPDATSAVTYHGQTFARTAVGDAAAGSRKTGPWLTDNGRRKPSERGSLS